MFCVSTCQMFVDDIVKSRTQKTLSLTNRMLIRRSISLNGATSTGCVQQDFAMKSPLNCDSSLFKRRLVRRLSFQKRELNSAREEESTSFQSHPATIEADIDESRIRFLHECEIQAALAATFDEFFDQFVHWLLMPAVVITAIVIAFVYLPSQPVKADIYRSLSVIFLLFFGVTLQGCFVTTWAIRRFGLSDLVALIQHWCRTTRTPSTH